VAISVKLYGGLDDEGQNGEKWFMGLLVDD